jgi:hypothetical protein
MLAVCGLAAILLGLKANAVREQRAVIAELSRVHVRVFYDHEHPQPDAVGYMPVTPIRNPAAAHVDSAGSSVSRSLKKLVGDDYFHDVTAAVLPSEEPADARAALTHLKRLPRLREVFIPSAPRCGLGLGPRMETERLLASELPGVKVTVFSILPPIVG